MVTVAPTQADVAGVLKGFDQFHLEDTPKATSPIAIPNADKVNALVIPAISLLELREKKVVEGAKILTSQAKQAPLRPHNSLSDSLNDLFVLETSPRVIYKPGVEVAKRAYASYRLLCVNGLSDVAPCTTEGVIPQYISRRDLEVSYELREDIQEQRFIVDVEKCFTLRVGDSGYFDTRDGCYSWQMVDGSKNLVTLSRKKTKLDTYLDEEFVLLRSTFDVAYLVPKKSCLYLSNVEKQFHVEAGTEEGEFILKPKTLRGHFPEERYVKLQRKVDGEKDEEMLVSKAILIPFVNETFMYENQYYVVSRSSDELRIEPAETIIDEHLDESFVFLKKTAKKIEIVPQSGCDPLLEEQDELYVKRDGVRFDLESTDWNRGTYRLVAKDAPGIFQEKVQKIFTGENGKVLDIGNAGPARTKFYQQICPKSFLRAFMAMILLRHEDGKIARLDESNFLFEVLADEKLRPIIIDLDDALPETNGPKADGTHRIRNGLMAFPQARKELDREQCLELTQLIEKIVAHARESQELLKQLLGPKHAESYQQIVEKLAGLQSRLPKTLEELFFALFPDYKAHWVAFSKIYSQPEEIALFVGERAPSHIRI